MQCEAAASTLHAVFTGFVATFQPLTVKWLSPQVLRELNSLSTSPHHRFVIALCLANGVCETGLPITPSEKTVTKSYCLSRAKENAG
jgi:hypothetical protein